MPFPRAFFFGSFYLLWPFMAFPLYKINFFKVPNVSIKTTMYYKYILLSCYLYDLILLSIIVS